MLFNGTWYCLYTNSKQEFIAREDLRSKGFNCYLPQIIRKTKSGRRFLEKKYPMFPCYIFVQADTIEDIYNLKAIRGSKRILESKEGYPLSVENNVLSCIDSYCTNDIYMADEDEFKKGDKLVIADQCMEGIEAIFLNYKNDRTRVDILLHLIDWQKTTVDSSRIKKLL